MKKLLSSILIATSIPGTGFAALLSTDNFDAGLYGWSIATGIAVGSNYGDFHSGFDSGTMEERSKISSLVIDDFSIEATAVPEPSSFILGLLGIATFIRRRR